MVCDLCQEKGLKDGICIHKQDSVPRWVGSNTELIKEMLEDDMEAYNRESLGFQSILDSHCFPKDWVERFHVKHPVQITEVVRAIYTFVDPSGGSCHAAGRQPSDFAIVSICEPYCTIVGFDLINAQRTTDYTNDLIDHWKRIRKIPGCQASKIYVGCETGSGYIAGDVEKIAEENFDNIQPLSDFINKGGSRDYKPGMLTTNDKKHRMMDIMYSFLRQESLRKLENCITSHKEPIKMWNELKNQMLNFEAIQHPPTLSGRPSKTTYSGKSHGRDDGVICLQMAMDMMYQITQTRKYEEFK